MPFYDAGDAAIFYEIHGDGPPVILLHGYGLNSLMWEFQAPVFSKSHRVIPVDLRGFGRSSCGEQWSGNAMADDVIGIIRELDLKDVTVTGFSLSGGSAIRTAIESPDIVTKLILVSSILPSRGRGRTEKEAEYQSRELETLRSHGVQEWAEKFGLAGGRLIEKIFERNPDVRPVWDRIIARHCRDYLLQMMEARKNTQSKVDWRSRLGEIKQKTLLVFGKEDKRFIDGAYHLDRAIPDTKLVFIDGAGHMVNLEKPREFNSKVIDFLTKR